MSGRVVRVLHCSDIHCGRPFVPDHVAAAETLATEIGCDAIVVSGDMSQRARVEEFREARVVLDRFAAIAPILTVPGNHDTEWWHAPFGFGDSARLHERWRMLVQPETQPTLRLPGLSIVGVNSASGMLPQALTWYPRDWRVKGGVTHAQILDARARLDASATGDLRMLVMHHNLVRGNLSLRWGLTRPQLMLDAFAELNVDVVCTGHDHEERVAIVKRRGGTLFASGANTLSNRTRGNRASAVNVIEADATHVTVTSWSYDAASRRFVAGTPIARLRAESRPTPFDTTGVDRR